MSVQNELDRIETNIANTYAVAESLGAEMPENQNSDNLARTVADVKAIRYNEQTLTEAEKIQARANIGAASAEDVRKQSEEIANLKVTDYVVTEAEAVLDRVLDAQGTRTFNMIVMTDLHNNGGASDTQIMHACQGAGYIADRVKIDAYTSLGDHTDNFASSSWADGQADMEAINSHTHKYLRNMDMFRLIGNHDFKEARSPKIFKLISAFSKGVEWGDLLGCYFSKDYEEYKLRVICMNTSDGAYINISNEQYNWLIERLDMSEKEDASEWQILIMSHVPLDWSGFNTTAVYILKAYLEGTSWTNGTISCDFTGKNQATIIATVHGHIHNFAVGNLKASDETKIDLKRIAMPETTELYHNHYGDPYKHSTSYPKTTGTADDTSFSVLCIDLDNKQIKAICYGAGVDRTIEYVSAPIEPDIPTEPDTPSTGYTNLVSTSEESNSAEVYNGVGYKNDTYLSTSSNGGDSEKASHCATGYIKGLNHVFYIKGGSATWNTASGLCRIFAFDSSKAMDRYASGTSAAGAGITVTDMGNGVLKFEVDESKWNVFDYVRICFEGTGESLIISNEPIVDTNYTNQIPISTDTDGSVFNTTGYETNKRINSSGVVTVPNNSSATTPVFATGFIPCKAGDIVRLKDCFIHVVNLNDAVQYGQDTHGLTIAYYNSNKTKLYHTVWSDFVSKGTAKDVVLDSDSKVTQFTVSPDYASASDVAFIRLTLGVAETAPKAIVTVNEPITGGATNIDLTWAINTKLDKATGVESAGEGYSASQMIDIEDGYTYELVSTTSATTGACICYYDANGTYLGYEEIWENATMAMSTKLTPFPNSASFKVRFFYGSAGVSALDAVSMSCKMVDYTNLVPTSKTLGGVAIYNDTGYKDGVYVSSETGGDSTDAECVATGLISYPTTQKSAPTIYIKGANLDTSKSHVRIAFYQEKYTYVSLVNSANIAKHYTIETLGTNYYKLTPIMYSETTTQVWYSAGDVKHIRVCLVGTGENLIVTLNEPIDD